MADDNRSIRQALYENVAKGWMEIVGEKDGEPIFRITEEGRRAVDEEMLNDPGPETESRPEGRLP